MEKLDTIIHGDAFEELLKLPEDSVDLVLTDPPYNISTDFEMHRDGAYDGAALSHDFGEWDQGDVTPDDWVPLCERVLKDNGTFISMYDNMSMCELTDALEEAGMHVRQKIYWHKTNPPPQGLKVQWQTSVEEMVVATGNEGQGHKFQHEEGQRHNHIETPLCTGTSHERTDHPTQKPEVLFEPILRWWTEPGDVVLDPFCGVGTVPKVADDMDRHWVGIEKDDTWMQLACERFIVDHYRHWAVGDS